MAYASDLIIRELIKEENQFLVNYFDEYRKNSFIFQPIFMGHLNFNI